jgi:dipeptidyl-peptidase-4
MKKRLLIAFVCLFVICFPAGIFSQTNAKEIKLENIWGNRTFSPKFLNEINPMKDGEHYSVLENDTINSYLYKTGTKEKMLVAGKQLIAEGQKEPLRIESYQFSNDETKLLLPSETEAIYRRSSKSNYFVWDIAAQKLTALSDKGKQRLADFSPDGSKVAFVRENNLFINDLATHSEEQITTDGLDRNIINGATDWVYEEEFEFSKGFSWSLDGSKIAFYRFDESKVKEYDMQMWGELYPKEHQYKYPKAGEANSVVNIFVYDINTKTTTKMDVGDETDQYIPRIKWTQDANVLCIYRMNRHQNKLELLLADAQSGKNHVIYTEENKYYIEIDDNLIFLNDNKHFILTNESDGYRHIYLYDLQGNCIRQLTRGNWEVTEIKGIDQKKGMVYYVSDQNSPLNRDVYAIHLSGKRKVKLTTREGNNDVDFSANFKYYINTFSDVATPPVYTLFTIKGKLIKVLEDNKGLADKMKEYSFGKLEFFKIKAADGTELNAYMIKPSDFDSTKKYPVLMNVYGGPGSQSVENRWGYYDFVWYQMLAQKGYISVSVDNRGTGARGEEFKKCTYQQLGKYETTDQIDAALYLGQLKYIDASRIGIWGWSYGGFMSTSCITKGADVFKMAIAVAPVTNWRYYDNIYTERFMRTPQENPSGYDDNSPINHVKDLKGKFLLVHGTADDNVHVQNSMDLISALVKNNKQFEMQFYPNKNHNIVGGYTRLHLYQRMTDFILKNL